MELPCTQVQPPIKLFEDHPLGYERSFVSSESIPTSDTTYRDHVAALPELMCELTPRIQYALEWAAYAHQHQSRYVMREGENGKMEKPHYIEHPYIVAAVVAQVTDDEDIIIAAILHDVVEDQPERMSFDIIEAEFGPRVRRIVRDVTKDNGMENKELRNSSYLEHVRLESCEEAKIVCLADKIHNIISNLDDYSALGEELWDKLTKPGKTIDQTKRRKYAWFNGVYEIMNEKMPMHPLTHILGDMVVMYKKISIDTIALSPPETTV